MGDLIESWVSFDKLFIQIIKKQVFTLYYCRVLICDPNPKYMGSQPNEPNTINL